MRKHVWQTLSKPSVAFCFSGKRFGRIVGGSGKYNLARRVFEEGKALARVSSQGCVHTSEQKSAFPICVFHFFLFLENRLVYFSGEVLDCISKPEKLTDASVNL